MELKFNFLRVCRSRINIPLNFTDTNFILISIGGIKASLEVLQVIFFSNAEGISVFSDV